MIYNPAYTYKFQLKTTCGLCGPHQQQPSTVHCPCGLLTIIQMIEGLFIYLRDERIATSKFLNRKVKSYTYLFRVKKFDKNKKI